MKGFMGWFPEQREDGWYAVKFGEPVNAGQLGASRFCCRLDRVKPDAARERAEREIVRLVARKVLN